MGKSLSNKYSQTLLDTAKKFTTDAIKTASEISFQKTAEAIGDLIGNEIADKIVSALKIPAKELPKEEDVEITTHKKRYILQKKDNNLLMN